ncbi:MAG: uroporphyrinogen-III synthase [Hasllibacter sp.]
MADLIDTRGGEGGSRLAAALRARAPGPWRIVACPLIGFRTLGASVPAGTVPIFTSARGAAACGPGTGPAWCVGPRTAEVARARGWDPLDGGGTAEALVRAVLGAPGTGPLLHVRGRHARGEVARTLRAAGRQADEIVAYEQPLLDPPQAAIRALRSDRALVVPLLSPRGAAHFAALARNASAPLHIVALSAAVADGWGGPVAAVSDRPDLPSLAAAAAPLLVAGGRGG